MDQRAEITKLLKEAIVETLQDIGIGKDFFRQNPNRSGHKSKIGQMGLYQVQKLGNDPHSEETPNRMQETICQLLI